MKKLPPRNYQQRESGQKIIKSTYIHTHTQTRTNQRVNPAGKKQTKKTKQEPPTFATTCAVPFRDRSETETERRYRPSDRNETKRNAATENQFQVCFSGIESSLDCESNTEHSAGQTYINTHTHTHRGRKIENFQQRSAQFASDLV